MKITIMNGNPEPPSKQLERYLASLAAGLRARNHSVTELRLRDMDIRQCVGCFGCWLKTPGECYHRDDSSIVCRQAVASDLLLQASPVIMGLISARLKRAMDKMVPLVLPYIRMYEGECHHLMRYEHNPVVGQLLHPDESTDAEDIEIIKAAYERNLLNWRCRSGLFLTTETPLEEALHAIDNI